MADVRACAKDGCLNPRIGRRSVCREHWNERRRLKDRARKGDPAAVEVLTPEIVGRNGVGDRLGAEELAGLTARNARGWLQVGIPNPNPALEAAERYGGIERQAEGGEEDPIAVLLELVARRREAVEGIARVVD